MREIKFRAWDKYRKEMFAIFDSEKQDNWFLPLWKLRHEIMQYTGLKDKNGKEIYEGDIVEFVDCQYESETLCVGEVIFEEFGWHFTNSITESSLSCYDSSEIKIIGNIYENKELLEVE
ncbi:YopX family protein [Tissierella praeacuta]|uniref:YopX family protein n=1 Tax=Tissierella praeacuta TaxID=43131 RepID=UPI003342AC4B